MLRKYNSVAPVSVSKRPNYSFPKAPPGAAGLSSPSIISQTQNMLAQKQQEDNCKNHAWIFSHGSFGGAFVLAIALVVVSVVLVELTKVLIPACTRWKRCGKEECGVCECEKEEEIVAVDENAERSGGVVVETAVIRGPGLGHGGLTGDGMRLVAFDLPLLRAGNGDSKIDTVASEVGERELPPPPYEPSSSPSISIPEAFEPQASTPILPPAITPTPTAPITPRSSAHLFVLGTCYTTLNILTLASLWFTTQNLIFCNGPTNPFLKFFLLPLILLSSTIHSTLGFSVYLVLLRNLWPERRIDKLQGTFGEAVKGMDEWFVFKGLTMAVIFPFVCVYMGILAPVGRGVVGGMEWVQSVCCGDEETERRREEEEGLLIMSLERDTVLEGTEVELMDGDLLRGKLRGGDKMRIREREDDEVIYQRRGCVVESGSKQYRSVRHTHREQRKPNEEPASSSTSSTQSLATSQPALATPPQFIPENMSQTERLAFFGPEPAHIPSIINNEEGKCARCRHKEIKNKGDLCQTCLHIRGEEMNGFMAGIGK